MFVGSELMNISEAQDDSGILKLASLLSRNTDILTVLIFIELTHRTSIHYLLTLFINQHPSKLNHTNFSPPDFQDMVVQENLYILQLKYPLQTSTPNLTKLTRNLILCI